MADSAEIEASRHPYRSELFLRYIAVRKVTQESLAAPRRSNHSEVGGSGRQGTFDHVLVAVALGCNHHERTRRNRIAREVGSIDEIGSPTQVTGQQTEGLRHR